MQDLDDTISVIRNRASLSVFSELEKQNNKRVSLEYARIARALHTLIKHRIYDRILTILDCLTIDQNYSLEVEMYDIDCIWGECRLYIKLPSGKKDYNIFNYIHATESEMGAFQLYLLEVLWHVLPLGDHANYAGRTYIFSKADIENLVDSFIDGEEGQEESDMIYNDIKDINTDIRTYSHGEYYYISCYYWSDFEGLSNEKYEIQIRNNKLINSRCFQNKILYEYNCGIRF